MPRSDELQRRRPRPDVPVPPDAGPADGPRPASKTQRKAEMHSLRDLGEELVALEPARLAELAADAALPDRLVDAVVEARKITAWGGRKRQLQFVGKLMREIDPEPVRRRLAAWAQGHSMDAARQHALERWRDRLLAEPDALDALVAAHPRLDRPRFRALIAKAQDERTREAPPHAYRELFRALKALDDEAP
ncbi:MAG: ribosome biogenesis factor YjgA [Betaproteobacteria bacterium]